MKLKIVYLLVISLTIQFSNAQKTLSKLLEKHNHNHIPYISVQELAHTNPVLLDARELSEYQVSHLKNAIYAGYNHFNLDSIQKQIPNKNEKIVVYCSLGIRSEIIANALKKSGYTNVTNLYGGIFEWKNNDFPVYNSKKKETDSIHTFSKEWRKWVKKGTKIYD